MEKYSYCSGFTKLRSSKQRIAVLFHISLISLHQFCHSQHLLFMSVFSPFFPNISFLTPWLAHSCSLQQSAFCSICFNSLSVLLSFCLTPLILCESLSCLCHREMTPVLKILVDRANAAYLSLADYSAFFFPSPFPCEL